MTKKKSADKIYSIILLAFSLAGIIYLVIVAGIPLGSVVAKLQQANLNSVDFFHDQYKPPKVLSLQAPQLDSSTREFRNETINLADEDNVEQISVEDGTFRITHTQNIKDSRFRNTTIKFEGNGSFVNCIFENVYFFFNVPFSANFEGSFVTGTTETMYLRKTAVTAKNTQFISNTASPLFHTFGTNTLILENSEFRENTGAIAETENEILPAKDGVNIFYPTLSITGNFFENNHGELFLINDLDHLSTKFVGNTFSGGDAPYIHIKDSQMPYLEIEQNLFRDQGILVENSTHIIIWGNKFENISNYAAHLLDSNLIAFQFNIFDHISPAGIFATNTPQVELVLNELIGTEEEIETTTERLRE